MTEFIAWAALGYLCGSLPFAVWITRLRTGKDVRAGGSGHATATNTIRQAGWKAGALVFGLDLAKGFLPTWLAYQWGSTDWMALAAAATAVFGHCWPMFAGFRGGMGLATSGGVYLAAYPPAFLIGLVLLILLLLLTRHGARSAVIVGLASPWVIWLLGQRGVTIWIAALTGGVIVVRFLLDWNRQYRELWLDRETK